MTTRRGVLRVLAALPVAAVAHPAPAREYRDHHEVRDAVDELAAVVEARLSAIVRVAPRAAAFAASVKADLARHRRERGGAVASPPAIEEAASLPRLRAAIGDLMHAHAEGLPAVGDRAARRRLGEHMVDLSRILTVVDLWMEMEGIE